jgi:Tol biopolymer transport system component
MPSATPAAAAPASTAVDPDSTAFFATPPAVEPAPPQEGSRGKGPLVVAAVILVAVVVGAIALLGPGGEPEGELATALEPTEPADDEPAAPDEPAPGEPAPDEPQDVTVTPEPGEEGETSAEPEADTPALPTEELAFVSDRDGEYDIFVVSPDGTGLRNLTRSPDSDDRQPAWSPDRRQVAFTSDRDGPFAVHVMDADGTGVRRLVDTDSFDPAWSPDGTAIAFSGADGAGAQRIMVLELATGELRQLTDGAGHAQRPHWSPDGTMLTYHSDADGSLDVFVVNADGTQARNLTEHPGADFHPRWSPDGRSIAFGSDRDGLRAVFVIEVATGDVRKVTDDPEREDYEPTWSPDGRWLALQSDRDDRNELHLVRSDGSGERVVVVSEWNALDPQWW